MAAGRRNGNMRMKPRKKTNRYNPNHPDYNAVHGSYFTRAILRKRK
jgi:hypothetical protein